MAETTLAIAGLIGGFLGLLLGGLAGAAMCGVKLWKGPAIVAAGMLGQLLLALLELGGYQENILIGWATFIIFAGLAAWALGVGVRASSVIIIGGLLVFLITSFALALLMLSLFPTA